MDNITTSKDAQNQQKSLVSMFNATFKTPSGEKVIKHLEDRFVSVPIAIRGDDLLNIGIRQGQATMVRYIMKLIEQAKEINNG